MKMFSVHKMGPQTCSVLMFMLLTASVHCNSPKVEIIPANGEIDLGTTKYFLCKASQEGTLKWMTSQDEEIENEDGKYEIKDVDETLRGLYVTVSTIQPERIIKCQVETDSGEIAEAQITLKVIQKPQFVGDLETQKEFFSGSSVKLPCSAKGIPAPQLSWIRNGKTVLNSQGHISVGADGTLHINKIQLSDAGMYTCRAYIHSREEEALRNVSVIVNAAPILGIQNSTENATTHSNASLTCFVTGYPQPEVTWRRGAVPVVQDGQKYFLSSEGQELSILHLEKADEGEYTCDARNTHGVVNSTMLLQVFSPAAGLGKGALAGIVLLIFLVLLLAIDLTCYRTKKRGFLMFISTTLLGRPNPAIKIQDNEIKKGSTDKSQVVNISGIDA
ncbi:neural cell adhesion molecule 1-like [Rhinophrynus dorsalis]